MFGSVFAFLVLSVFLNDTSKASSKTQRETGSSTSCPQICCGESWLFWKAILMSFSILRVFKTGFIVLANYWHV